MLVDANVLLYAVDESGPFHERARGWMEEALNGNRRVGLPWLSISAFLRLVTHPRAMADPLGPEAAWAIATAWLDAAPVWVPEPGPGHREILGRLLVELDLRANLVSDAVLAALCIEHGLEIVSADSDFARFDEITWINPVAR
ncbi:MAG: PIN domain-containing protein [Actinomycetota bacterium]|nr:PIN domain-containing protein [Acidimicrobiia bacterium]MDQ3293445.1 PIN domain-containing protein [Actinomycetota bacterium]